MAGRKGCFHWRGGAPGSRRKALQKKSDKSVGKPASKFGGEEEER